MEQYGIKCSNYVLNKGGGTKNSKMKGYAFAEMVREKLYLSRKNKPNIYKTRRDFDLVTIW
jgi:hypothetical protein